MNEFFCHYSCGDFVVLTDELPVSGRVLTLHKELWRSLRPYRHIIRVETQLQDMNFECKILKRV